MTKVSGMAVNLVALKSRNTLEQLVLEDPTKPPRITRPLTAATVPGGAEEPLELNGMHWTRNISGAQRPIATP